VLLLGVPAVLLAILFGRPAWQLGFRRVSGGWRWADPLVGLLIPDPWLHARVTMRAERKR